MLSKNYNKRKGEENEKQNLKDFVIMFGIGSST
jgi:hypothetical protein